MKVLAFVLPQFHPIPENDAWWGHGFTEWTNVARAMPAFPGHHQPHVPADLGFYDMRLAETRDAQAALARAHGITGFCYYHYWFTGRRVLERPVDRIVASGQPDFPFCLCWANENWTRTWDGKSEDVLLEQKYSEEDDRRHIEALIPYLSDRRYIRIGGRPLFLVYRTELLPEPARTSEIWRDAVSRAGLGDLYLARVESFTTAIDPRSIGFDAAVEFAPDWRRKGTISFSRTQRLASLVGLWPKGYFRHRYGDYREMARLMQEKPQPDYRWYRCVTPGFDNSPRRQVDATILLHSTPEAYRSWLAEVVRRERSRALPEEEKIVFLNAWNEWAEGNHLEPDLKWGREYLEATKAAIGD